MLQRPDSWLKKVLSINQASVWLSNPESPSSGGQLPLLRMPKLEVAALLPLYAVIEGTRETVGSEPLHGNITVQLQHLDCTLTQDKILRLRQLATVLAAMRKGGYLSPCSLLYRYARLQICLSS